MAKLLVFLKKKKKKVTVNNWSLTIKPLLFWSPTAVCRAQG